MPVGDGEQADTDGYGRADLGAIDRHRRWEVVGDMSEDAEVQQQSKDENAQFDQASRDIRDDFDGTFFAKVEGAGTIQHTQESGDPQRDGNQ